MEDRMRSAILNQLSEIPTFTTTALDDAYSNRLAITVYALCMQYEVMHAEFAKEAPERLKDLSSGQTLLPGTYK